MNPHRKQQSSQDRASLSGFTPGRLSARVSCVGVSRESVAEVKYQEQEQTDTAKMMLLKASGQSVATQSSSCSISGCHLCHCMHKITSESAITPYSNGLSSLPTCFLPPVHTALSCYIRIQHLKCLEAAQGAIFVVSVYFYVS